MYLNPRHFASAGKGSDGRRQGRLRKELQLSGWDSPLNQKFSVPGSQFLARTNRVL